MALFFEDMSYDIYLPIYLPTYLSTIYIPTYILPSYVLMPLRFISSSFLSFSPWPNLPFVDCFSVSSVLLRFALTKSMTIRLSTASPRRTRARFYVVWYLLQNLAADFLVAHSELNVFFEQSEV